MIRRAVLAATLAAAAFALPASAQAVRPWLDWRTLRTEHFDVHFPAGLEPWTRGVAERLEAIHGSVGGLVGSVPDARVTIVVDDPAGQANGSAFPFIRAPYVLLYPTPPEARSALAHTRGAAEMLALHEFAHIAHLTRPSRNPFRRLVSIVDPLGLGPVLRTAPRWVTEGYATYAEGRLTGYGRPHGVLRAAILRQWALEGRLPAYEQLSATSGGFQVPGMAYLAGSAFLEWLAERQGDASLPHLWRRMSARQERSFDEAFRGVYGGSPRELYGLFTVEVTANALQARRMLADAGLVTGDTVQHLAWSTGDPAVSPDGAHLALMLGGATGAASRVVVWRTDEPPGDSAAAAADSALLARDSLDVPAIRVWPRARRPLAVLRPEDGVLPYGAPRFLPGGRELLLVRSAGIGGGATREDLFVWNWRDGGVRRVTRGAGIRAADPLPDGRRAAAVQCRDGICSLVLADLATGAVTPLAPGSLDRVFDRPRVSPDGRTVAAAVQEDGRWTLVTVDVETGALRIVRDDAGASSYDPAWSPDGASLTAVAEAGGVANLARVDPRTGELRALTRVTGAAVAPEPDPATGGVYFLSLHAGGWDLHRIHPDSVGEVGFTVLPDTLAPAARRFPAAAADTLPRAPLPASRPYGIGPRWTRPLPMAAAGADGAATGILLHNADPVGRLALAARGAWGERGLERGASATALWRGWRPAVGAEGFWTEHEPSRRPGYDGAGRDARYGGGALWMENGWRSGRNAQQWRLGASAGRLAPDGGNAGARTLGFARYAVSDGWRSGARYAAGSLALDGAAGRTRGEDWARGTVTAVAAAGLAGLGLRAEGTAGRVSRAAPAWERFAVGGVPSLLGDGSVMSQRIAMPALRWGALEGEQVLTYRLSTSLGSLTPYLWGGTADPQGDRWLRVAGLETSLAVAPLRAGAIPGGRVLAGVAYTLDGRYAEDVTGYISITFAP